MLDVGANAGVTCAITKRNRPDIRIIAFEPIPQNLTALRRVKRFCHIEQMDIQPFAVSDYIGTAQFAIPKLGGVPATGLSHALSSDFANPDVEKLPFETVSVDVRTLDFFAYPRVNAIKVDVENHEYHVLKGAERLLSHSHPVVLCELWDTGNRPQTIELMDGLGYITRQLSEIDFLFLPRNSEAGG